MGTLAESAANDTSLKTSFIKHLLNDVKCLELVLQHNMIESGTTRIGAEQEFCLITKNQRPQRNADEILKAVNDPHFTPELARFNLEINLDPHKLEGSCFSQIENQLNKLLALAKDKAADYDTDILLTGILPTICKNELTMEYMTPMRRFQSLNQMVKGMRGSDFQLYIQGVDDLAIKHDSILMEACNTSFQMHLQVDPEDFIDSYNWAQAIAGPVLGVSANSPILLGRELWNETRIALFQQSIDTRNYSHALKDQSSRVNFGQDWEYGTIADLYKNEIANHKIILAGEVTHDSLGDLENGKIPKLQALNTHNGTIYRWNRACY
ncbi:MAG: signal transduction protein, partial [Ekhidna sp.]|nr:signal transduction protein [Ekhidna sp.]